MLKIAKVKPLYKTKIKVTCKILDHYPFYALMYNGLISFLSRNNTLSKAQNGFREERSTETAILS
jgi:hypothetical protein